MFYKKKIFVKMLFCTRILKVQFKTFSRFTKNNDFRT